MLKCWIVLRMSITTIFNNIEALKLTISYFNNQNSYEYVIKSILYKIIEIENGIQAIVKCLNSSENTIDLSK